MTTEGCWWCMETCNGGTWFWWNENKEQKQVMEVKGMKD